MMLMNDGTARYILDSKNPEIRTMSEKVFDSSSDTILLAEAGYGKFVVTSKGSILWIPIAASIGSVLGVLLCIGVFIASMILVYRLTKRAVLRKDAILLEPDFTEDSDMLFSFSKSVNEIVFSDLAELQMLGQGAQSIVMRAKWKSELVAVKLFSASSMAEQDFSAFEREVEAMIKLRHPVCICY